MCYRGSLFEAAYKQPGTAVYSLPVSDCVIRAIRSAGASPVSIRREAFDLRLRVELASDKPLGVVAKSLWPKAKDPSERMRVYCGDRYSVSPQALRESLRSGNFGSSLAERIKRHASPG